MTKERMGEIAILVIKDHAMDRGISVSNQSRRQIGNIAQRIGVSVEELTEFFMPLIQEAIETAFTPPKPKK